MAKRFRSKVNLPGDPSETVEGEVLHATRDRALKEGIDTALREGVIEVLEVEAEQKVRREWVEKTKP